MSTDNSEKKTACGLKGWILWLGVFILLSSFLVWDIFFGNNYFGQMTSSHPFIMGFIKVSVLASMGELLAVRITKGEWKIPCGMLYRFIIWGLLGISFAIVFPLFAGGVVYLADTKKFLLMPFEEGLGRKILLAFWTSLLTNIIFAPTMMGLHRITDTWIDIGKGRLSAMAKVSLREIINSIDWNNFVGFVVRITIPLFWIPAHTFTFSLPAEYQVLSAAYLSVFLGGILAFAKSRQKKL